MEHKETVLARHSIRTKLLFLFFGLTTVILLVSSYFGVSTLLAITDDAQEISQSVLKEQAADFMVQIVEKTAQQNDATLNMIRQDANYIAFYANDIFANPEHFYTNSQWRAEEYMFLGDDGQYINDENSTVSVYLPNTAQLSEDVVLSLELSSYLDAAFQSIYENSDNITAIYLGTEDEITRYYPNINLGAILPPDFIVSQRPWYINATQENPDGQVVWSDIYEDATGQGLLVTASIPIQNNDKLVGVIGIDVSLNDIQETIESSQVFENSYTFLIDEIGQAIVLPEQGYLDILNQPSENFDTIVNLKDNTSNFSAVITAMLSAEKGFTEVQGDGESFMIAYAPLKHTGWSLATVIPEAQLLQSITFLQQELNTNARDLIFSRLLVSGLLLLVLAIVLGFWVASYLVNPVKKLVVAVQGFGQGDLDISFPTGRKDEIGVLADTFQDVTGQLRDTMNRLEERVDERTKYLENRAEQLQTATQVAQEVLVFRNANELLENASQLISDKFSFYHTGIFLLDKQKEYAILQAAASDGGKKMLERGHQLRVGDGSVVGDAVASKRPRIALDVGPDPVYFNNPDLPATHSEMALPLLSQGEVLGVLDIQSADTQAFDQQDIETFQTLANQLGLALQNARLLEEAQESVALLETFAGEQTQSAWKTHFKGQTHGFLYTPLRTKRVKKDRGFSSEKTGVRTEIPISLRGKTVGKIALKRPLKQWSNKEKTLISDVAEQVGLAIENSRLVDETREQANRDQLISEFSTKLRETLDMNTVVKTAIEEMREIFKLKELEVRLNSPDEEKDKK